MGLFSKKEPKCVHVWHHLQFLTGSTFNAFSLLELKECEKCKELGIANIDYVDIK